MGFLRKKRQERGLRALASGSLAFARAHAVLSKTEKELEQALEKDDRKAPESCIGKTRFKGQKVLHSKQVLLCIVLLNILDCVLVLGELILDIYYLKGVLESEQAASYAFVSSMRNQYPTSLGYMDNKDIALLRNKLLHAHIVFSKHHMDTALTSNTPKSTAADTHHGNEMITTLTPMLDIDQSNLSTISTSNNESTHSVQKRNAYSKTHNIVKRGAKINVKNSNMSNDTDEEAHSKEHHDHQSHSIEEKVAHIFHYCSVTILGILVVETVLKISCNGKEFFEKKLEGCVVVVSFVVDLVFIKGLSVYEIQQFVIILAFLVPWRVIRVVNSLVVAVMDHEHFRMKLLYKQKKEVSNELKNTKNENKNLQNTLEHVKDFAIRNGISEKSLNTLIAMHRQTPNTKKTKKLLNGFSVNLISKSSSVSPSRQISSTSSVDSANFSFDNASEKISNDGMIKEDNSAFVEMNDNKGDKI